MRLRKCSICPEFFPLVKSGQRKYCHNCVYRATLLRNRSYGDRHTKESKERYYNSPKHKEYMRNYLRGYWRGYVARKKQLRMERLSWMKGYLTSLKTG